MSAFHRIAELSPQTISPGIVVRPIHGERITLSVVELDPGVPLPEHRHDNEQVGMVVSGSLEFHIGDEVMDVSAGSAWCIPSGVPHTVTTGPEGAVLIETFSPARADWLKLEQEEPRKPRWP